MQLTVAFIDHSVRAADSRSWVWGLMVVVLLAAARRTQPPPPPIRALPPADALCHAGGEDAALTTGRTFHAAAEGTGIQNLKDRSKKSGHAF